MEISLIYVLIVAEVMLILIGLSITLTVILLGKTKGQNTAAEQSPLTEEEKNIDLGNSYIDFLEQAIERNNEKTKQQENIEAETDTAEDHAEADKEAAIEEAATEEPTVESTPEETDNNSDIISPVPDEAQSKLLAAREQFLQLEKAAAEKTEHEIHFWDSIYEGMKSLLEQFTSTQTITKSAASSSETDAPEQKAAESKEKVFYIETQRRTPR